jgi:hypothetical protein
MYSRAAHESLAKPSPLTARSVERGLCSNPYPHVLPERATVQVESVVTSPAAGFIPPDGRMELTSLTCYYLTAHRISSKVKDNVATTLLAGPNLIANKS